MLIERIDRLIDRRSLLDHPFYTNWIAGTLPLVASPVRFSDEAPQPQRHPPLLGEHTVEVLTEAGFSREQIAAWLADGTVAGR